MVSASVGIAIALILRFYAREAPLRLLVEPLGDRDEPIGNAPADGPPSANHHVHEPVILCFTQEFAHVIANE
jgi:hypothetical protein